MFTFTVTDEEVEEIEKAIIFHQQQANAHEGIKAFLIGKRKQQEKEAAKKSVPPVPPTDEPTQPNF